jgi:hypothetical protein
MYHYEVPDRRLFVAVKLMSSASASIMNGVRSLAGKLFGGDDIPILAQYQDDINLVIGILSRYDCRKPSHDEIRRLEAWFDYGRSSAPVLIEKPTYIDFVDADPVEFAAVVEFASPIFNAPNAPWLSEAMNHTDGASVVSIRGAFEHPTTTRKRAKNVLKRLNEQKKEEADTLDAELGPRIEDERLEDFAKQTEEYFAENRTASLTDVSIIIGRRMTRDAKGNPVTVPETYIDHWRNNWGIDCKVLSHRQM